VTTKLPAMASRKLATLQQAALDSRALQQAALAATNACRDEVFALTNTSQPDFQLVAAAKAKLASAEALSSARSRATANAHQTLAQLETFLRKLPKHEQLQEIHAPGAKLRKGLSIGETVEAVREDLEGLQAELRKVTVAPLPKEDLKATATAYVRELAERGKPAMRTHAGQFTINWRPDTSWERSGNAMAHVELAAYLAPEAMIERLHADIDALAVDDAGALPAHLKAGRVAELEAQIFALELQEEACICAATAQQMTILRRPKANPLAVLGCKVVQRKAVAKAA
jgi:hypothetical protein